MGLGTFKRFERTQDNRKNLVGWESVPVTVSEGWALELCGEAIDLDDLREALRPPFDPWVEEYLDGETARLLLRSKMWAGLGTTGEMMAEARRLVDQINGAHLVGQSDAKPITAGITLRFRADGTRDHVMIAATGHFKLEGMRVRMHLSNLAVGPPPEPAPSPMQRRIARAVDNEIVADFLTFIARLDNWFDLYKALELAEDLCGGETDAKRLEPRWKSLKRTANRYRHAPGPKHTLPPRPATIDEGREILLRIARAVI